MANTNAHTDFWSLVLVSALFHATATHATATHVHTAALFWQACFSNDLQAAREAGANGMGNIAQYEPHEAVLLAIGSTRLTLHAYGNVTIAIGIWIPWASGLALNPGCYDNDSDQCTFELNLTQA